MGSCETGDEREPPALGTPNQGPTVTAGADQEGVSSKTVKLSELRDHLAVYEQRMCGSNTQ